MTDQLTVGMTFEKTITVTEELCPRFLAGSGILVIATPELVRLMEQAAQEGVGKLLPPHQNTVGVRVELRHLAATPVGMTVTARCTLTEIDRRRLTFTAEVHDALDKVAEGTHERFIVDTAKQQERLQEKAARWKGTAPS
jgi:predicted thioesterase